MTLAVIGAGLGRTGSNSLKVALERLLGAPCYHTHEVILNLDHVAVWQAAFDGSEPDWDRLLTGYAAAVDWPACKWWRQLADRAADALVVLSTRASSQEWWDSAVPTVFASMKRGPLQGFEAWHRMMQDAMQPFTDIWDDKASGIAAYEAHNDEVRRDAPPGRLVEWQPADGWLPLCEALGVAVPDEPFPHLNTTPDFRALAALD
jgi:hypothetical protein